MPTKHRLAKRAYRQAAVALALIMISTPALTAPADIIAARQAKFKDMGRNFKVVNDQLRKPAPDLAAMRPAAQRVRALLDEMARGNWFPNGTGPAPGVKTTAKAEIWSQAAAFKTARVNAAGKASALDAALKAGDMARIKLASRDLGAACGACHKAFRAEED